MTRRKRKLAWCAAGAAVCALALAGPIQTAGAGTPESAVAAQAGSLRWIVEGPGTQNALAAIQRLDPGLAAAYFDTSRATILSGDASPSQAPASAVPPGWAAAPAQHYTSYGPCTSDPACSSLSRDIGSGAIAASGIPTVMYDDENWSKTPDAEKSGVCSAMQQFTQLAHANGLASIMAPDQNLASPGVITSFQGGESQDWQTYLRLGLASCAAASGTNAYHIMSQPFETHWCGGQGGACEGSEADFAAFVTQAALQARGVSPGLTLTAGLTTNPRYNATPQALYQDTLDTGNLVGGYWLNVAGNPSNPGTAVQYLEMLSGAVPLYLGSGAALGQTFPAGSTSATIPLAATGSDHTFVSGQDLPGGTTIPAGAYRFEPWTDGSSGSAAAGLEVGYCTPPACTDRTPIIQPGSWTADLPAGDPGVTSTYQTSSPATLPPGGPYRLYLDVHIRSGAGYNLLYGAGKTSTNLAVPRPSSEPAGARSPVLFAQRGNRLGTALPAASSPASLSLAQPGNTATFISGPALHAGVTVPAGAWQFQYWTGGSGQSATVSLQTGYCAGSCTRRTPIIAPTAGWQATVQAGARGAADPGGAFTTTAPTQLPASGGPYHLYWTVTVTAPGNFGLRYDAAQAPTNVATPLLMPLRGPHP